MYVGADVQPGFVGDPFTLQGPAAHYIGVIAEQRAGDVHRLRTQLPAVMQPTFSFKIRGAYNKLVQLSDEQKARGVITASAGNHAQGVALAARELGIKATIVMPSTTPELKVLGVRSRGAEAVLQGASFPFALAHALQLAEQSGGTFVSPFDDPDVIAGQGTVAMEILRQQQGALDAIFVPVGGGGLIAGIAAYIKYLRPQVRVIGVEPEGSSCLLAALDAGERVILPSVDS